MATPKRAVVLRLAELERYPTLKARYEITLPFNNPKNPFENPLACNCPRGRPLYHSECQGCDLSISFAKLKAKAIKQTEKRWVWFSEARRLDDRLGRRLGTLGYLPLEIREIIWCAAIDNYKDFHYYFEQRCWDSERDTFDEAWLNSPLDFERSHEWHRIRPHDQIAHLDIFHLHSYHKHGPWPGGEMELRFASPQVKIELENIFISTNVFRFFCPFMLDHFLDQFSACQGPQLRSIILQIFGCSESCSRGTDCIRSDRQAWVAVIQRLPATLRFVTFELGRYRRPRGLQYKTLKDVKKGVALLENITKKAQRRAPRAKISLVGLDIQCGEDRQYQHVMDEVEPFSEDFKKWSDQSRQNAMV